eukprot:693380-Hanusia_phi.AAC.3
MASHQLVAVKGSLYRKKFLLLRVQGQGVSLVDPLSLKESWNWSFQEDSLCLAPSSTDPDEIIITVKSKASAMKRVIGMTGDIESRWVLSCTNRSKLLSEALFMRDAVLGESHEPSVHMALYGKAWDGHPKLQVQLIIRPYSFSISKGDGEVLEDVTLFAIQRLRRLGDIPGGFALKHMSNSLPERLLFDLVTGSNLDLGCSVSFTELEQEAVALDRVRLSAVESWPVQKLPSPKAAVGQTAWRKASPEPLVLMFTGKEILECQVDTLRVNVSRTLQSVVSVQRSLQELQRFSLVFDDGSVHIYETANRDVLLVALESMLSNAGANSSKKLALPSELISCPRMLPYNASPDFVMFVQSVVVKRLASLVDSGLLLGGDDHDLVNPYVVQAAMELCSNQSDIPSNNLLDAKDFEMAVNCVVKQLGGIGSLSIGDNTDLIVLMHALCFLVQSKTGFTAFAKLFAENVETFISLVKFLKMSLKSSNKEIQMSTITTMMTLLSTPHSESKEFKNSLEDKRGSTCLLMETLKFLECLICTPGNITTSEETVQLLKEILADNQMMICLLSHNSRPVSSTTWKLFEQIVCTSDDAFVASMSLSALQDGEGAMLRQFHSALFHPEEKQRSISAKMVAVWVEGNPEATGLIHHCLPRGMGSLAPQLNVSCSRVHGSIVANKDQPQTMQSISEVDKFPSGVPAQSLESSDLSLRSQPGPSQASVDEFEGSDYLSRQRKREEWQCFIEMLRQDKHGILYCWNEKSRIRLKDCLEAELKHLSQWRDLAAKRDGKGCLCWNYREFYVSYPCLDELICVEGFFLKEVLKVAENGDEQAVMKQVDDAITFFQSLYRKMLETKEDEDIKIYLDVMSMICRHKHEELLKWWSDRAFYGVQYLVQMLERTRCKGVRDSILACFHDLFAFRANCEEFITCGGPAVLLKFAACVHVERHSGNHVVRTDKMIEAGKETTYEQQEYRLWYCSELEEDRAYLLSEIQESLHAQKIRPSSYFRLKDEEQWKPLSEFPQLHLTIGLQGKGMTHVDVSVTCLKLIYKLCRLFPSFSENGIPFLPVSRIKRNLWSRSCLSHIVQLMLSGHESVVDEAVKLLMEMLHSGDTVSLRKLYKTGFFFFALGYPRSNVHGISWILKRIHLDQDFYRRDSLVDNSFSPRRSILYDLLPESLICFLHRHTSENFAEMYELFGCAGLYSSLFQVSR